MEVMEHNESARSERKERPTRGRTTSGRQSGGTLTIVSSTMEHCFMSTSRDHDSLLQNHTTMSTSESDTTDQSASYMTDDQLTAYQKRRLRVVRALADAIGIEHTIVFTESESHADDEVLALDVNQFELFDDIVWLPEALLDMIELGEPTEDVRDGYRNTASRYSEDGFDAFEKDGLSEIEKQRAEEIRQSIQEAEKGDQVVWNGRATAQPVTKVGGSWIEVTGNRGGKYRHIMGGEDEAPYMKNLNSDTEYDLDDFQIAQKASELEEEESSSEDSEEKSTEELEEEAVDEDVSDEAAHDEETEESHDDSSEEESEDSDEQSAEEEADEETDEESAEDDSEESSSEDSEDEEEEAAEEEEASDDSDESDE